MKTLRQLSAATILSLTLAASVFAGHIETPGAPAPAPTPTSSTTTTTTSTTDVITSILLTILGLT